MEIAIDRIIVPEGRRPLDPAKVVEIAGSIKLLGLLAPIGLRSCVDGRIELVWGGHRLAACQSLGMESIYAIQVDTRVQGSAADLDDYVKMMELAENLHRNELTTSQRDEFLAAWVALVEKRGPQLGGGRQVKKPGPKPSHAMAEVAKTSGIGLKTVKEAVASSKVSPEVKAAADDAGLTSKQRLAISRLPEADQLAGVSKRAAINIVADRAEATSAAAKVKPVAAPSVNAVASDDVEPYVQEGIEDRIDGEDPENYRTAFLLRADQAVYFAAYSGPKKYNKSLAPVARKVVSAWITISEQLESKPKKPKTKTTASLPSDPIEEPCDDCNSEEERWQRSLGNMAGDAVSLPSYWTREFGEWEKFEVPTSLVTLVKQAAKAWAKLEADLTSADPLALPEFKRTAS